MLSVKRPGTGIAPKFLDKIIGLTVKKDIQEDKPIQWENIDKEK
jgi:sialic acid synthase SpsE